MDRVLKRSSFFFPSVIYSKLSDVSIPVVDIGMVIPCQDCHSMSGWLFHVRMAIPCLDG